VERAARGAPAQVQGPLGRAGVRVARLRAHAYGSGVRAVPAALAALAVLALLAPPPAKAAPPADSAVERRREAIAKDLLRVGAELRRAIERGDAAPLLARVPDAGLRCGDRTVPKARVARDLAASDSWLHGVFFGGIGYAPPPGRRRRSPPCSAARRRSPSSSRS